jgi:hypothetical protein
VVVDRTKARTIWRFHYSYDLGFPQSGGQGVRRV